MFRIKKTPLTDQEKKVFRSASYISTDAHFKKKVERYIRILGADQVYKAIQEVKCDVEARIHNTRDKSLIKRLKKINE